MAESRTRRDDVLQQLSRLSGEHELILLKRHTILQMQKHKTVENRSRQSEKKKTMEDANRLNKQLLDDISTAERHLKSTAYSVSENRLYLLKDNYFDFVKAKCHDWLKEIEIQREDSNSVDSM